MKPAGRIGLSSGRSQNWTQQVSQSPGSSFKTRDMQTGEGPWLPSGIFTLHLTMPLFNFNISATSTSASRILHLASTVCGRHGRPRPSASWSCRAMAALPQMSFIHRNDASFRASSPPAAQKSRCSLPPSTPDPTGISQLVISQSISQLPRPPSSLPPSFIPTLPRNQNNTTQKAMKQ